jgi:hypothetical protein
MTLRKLRTFPPDWLIGAFCLLVPALYNSFPLVTSDSGGYISNSHTLYLPIDRPVGYSVFIRITALDVSLWGTVLIQALLLSGLLLAIAKHVLGTTYRRAFFTVIMLLTGVATSAGWTCGQLSPDVFTPIMLLAVCVLAFIPCSTPAKWLLYLLVAGCMLIHNSNLLIGLLLSAVMIIYGWRKKKSAIRQTGIALISAGIVSWVGLSSMNAIAGRGFRPSSATHVFLMSRMVENGIAQTYLKDKCPTESYSLCAYKNQLPDRQWTFMWDTSGALYKAGGWQATEAEYSRIIRNTLASPKYLGMHIVKNAAATLRQLPLIYAGDELAALKEGTSPYKSVERYYPDELNEYRTSLQQENQLKLEHWNVLIVLFSLLVIIAALLWDGGTPIAYLRGMAGLSVIFVLLNAAVTATFATVVARYEARVFWVLPFLAILYLVRRYRAGKEAH